MDNLRKYLLPSEETISFILKLSKKEYISTYLYEIIKKENPEIIPKNFDLEIHNDKVISYGYKKYHKYFEDMYKDIDPNIHLDKEQIRAILSDEDFCLIIAGAGTGKTTTMVSKVKYLVDIKKVNPSKIIVMSYTKKATEELEKRINLDFSLGAKVTTFHSLGLMHIREIFKDRKCYVIDNNEKEAIFLDYFKNNIFPYKDKVRELLTLFANVRTTKRWLFGSYFTNNYDKYKTFDEYFENYKKYRLEQIPDLKEWINYEVERNLNSEVIRTIKGEIVKSKGEAIIANYLYINNIEYQYEKIYEKLMPENKTYRPDFTLNLNGQDVYLEYFGLSTYKENELNRYEKIKNMKIKYHKKHHNKFIRIDYQKNENIIKTLNKQLLDFGFILKRKSNIEIFNTILDNNKLSQFYPFKDLIYKTIETIKSSSSRNDIDNKVNKYLNSINKKEEKDNLKKQYEYIIDFYKYYQSKLIDGENYGFDFSDMIYYANLYINKIDRNNNLNFEYLIIDEYQDISEERYKLTKNIARRNTAKIIAVGDDWQSIYAFAGSKIEYTYDFLNYFPGSKLLKITNTYRNSKQLIDYSGTFIMRNKRQIQKDLVSSKDLKNPIKFVYFKPDEEYKKLKKLIIKIHQINPNHNIMVLGRTNSIIEECYNEPDLIDEMDTKIKFIGYEDIDIDGMTFHKSKGLTADEVILIGLDSNFPTSQPGFWLENIFKPVLKREPIPYPEERRLFYVALTRTKNNVYLLVNEDKTKCSPFINELRNIIDEKIHRN